VKKFILKEDMPHLFGYSMSIVISGSMEPELSVNDLIIIKGQESYDIGDIITYRNGNNYVTHRIVENLDTGFITKGDANNVADLGVVEESNILGKTVFVIPNVGALLLWIKSSSGIIVMSILIVALLTITYIVRRSNREN